MKIAMFGHKAIPSCDGGIEVVVGQLATRMQKRGHEVTCYNRYSKSNRNRNLKEFHGVRIKNVLTINKKGFAAITSAFSAAVSCAFNSYDVVHIHAEGPAIMCWLPKLCGKKVVVTIHGLDHQRAKWGRLASWIIKKGESNAARYADKIIVLSKEVQGYFKQVYNRSTTYIPNGVSKPRTEAAELIVKKWGLQKDSYILYLGRIVPEKGEHYLLEAFKKIHTDKKLVIAGGSSDTLNYYNELKSMANNDNRIVFTGFVQGKLKAELYSNAYVYTLPSDLEGMPLSLLEAMSYGNCCLTSDIAECTEVIEDKAVTFKKGDVASLTEKLQLLCDNDAVVKKYKENAAEYILQKYSWNDVVEKTLKLYRR